MDDLNELPDNVARALKALEADADRAAARVNTGRVADGVLKRLRQPEVVEVRHPSRGWLRIAAALVVLLGGAGLVRRLVEVPDNASVAAGLPIQWQREADSLAPTEAQALLGAIDSLNIAPAESSITSRVSLDDLSETELQALLRSMETSEGTI